MHINNNQFLAESAQKRGGTIGWDLGAAYTKQEDA